MCPLHQISVFPPKKYYFPSADGCSDWHLVKMLTKQIYTGEKNQKGITNHYFLDQLEITNKLHQESRLFKWI